eukprot:CAMPEP_0206608212 /NCGR_PEP_ID=MMETSP0325_2-20121206/52819_1 /ASSEMBLY_ACC=CAM_ASM_000347 /TAXON_ID=2866 /ORGANISM="Crypthecodinium cohnii, Strain Seligo" /LENGTH=673 /DNA_ID=CAMNT_0054125789 /DNA_START=90 /DNA_END=2111 /DNA_ORIENTATION=-
MDVNLKARYGLSLMRGHPDRPPLQRETQIFHICNALVHGQRPEAFPGMQPTSLTRAKVEEELLSRPYLVCEKTDGERNLLLAFEGRVYLIDRVPQVWLCPLQLPLPPNHPRGPGWHHNTLLDGELVLDSVMKAGRPTGEKCLRYLVYDVVSINGEDLTHRTLIHRLRRALSDVVLPKESLLREHPADDPMHLYVKDFFELWHLRKVMEIGERLPHKTDGLIFTPVMVPYLPGSCLSLLKWKPASANTVDFKMQVVKGVGRFLHVKLLVGFRKQMEWHVDFSGLWLAKTGDMFKKLQADPAAFDGLIGECCWRTDTKTFIPSSHHVFVNEGTWEDGGWVLQRLREDKSMPNDLRTAKRVVESIEDDLNLEDLHKLVMNAKEAGLLKAAADCGEGELERVQLPPQHHQERREFTSKFQGAHAQRFKGKHCRAFQRGNCTYGKACKFVHSKSREGTEAQPIKDGSLEGDKKEDDLELEDGEEVMPEDPDEKSQGFTTESGIEMIPRAEMEVCRWFARGCRRGLACPNLHPGDSRQSEFVPKDPEIREKGGWWKGKGKSRQSASSKGKSSEGQAKRKDARASGASGKGRGKKSERASGSSGGKGPLVGPSKAAQDDRKAKDALLRMHKNMEREQEKEAARQAKRQRNSASVVSQGYGSTLLDHTAASLPAKAKAAPA